VVILVTPYAVEEPDLIAVSVTNVASVTVPTPLKV
jgi:hypothetical protein